MTVTRGRLRLVLSIAAACILAAVAARADVYRLLDSDQEAAQARIDLVQRAREEIQAEYFIVETDQVSLTGLGLLRDAARRGVKVRLIVDATFNNVARAIQGYLISQGVEIREYHPFRWTKPRWIWRRMHDKLLVVDGRSMLAGGRNIANSYFGFGKRNYVDRDALVEGGAAKKARDYFLELWSSGEVRATRLRSYDPGFLEYRCEQEASHPARRFCLARQEKIRGGFLWAQRLLDDSLDRLRRGSWVRYDSGRDFAAGQADVGEVRFLHDPVGRKVEARGIGRELLDLMAAATRSMEIESPYLVPSAAFKRALKAALRRGVAVRILTNSLGSTDNLFAQAGYVGKRKKLVRWGVDLWEYKGPESLHAKSAVFDGETVVVGSFNINPRSEYLDTEIALVATQHDLALQLQQSMNEHLRNAFRIGSNGKPEGRDDAFPGVAGSKVLKLRLLQLLAPFLRRQL